jgi:hypothetical protein
MSIYFLHLHAFTRCTIVLVSRDYVNATTESANRLVDIIVDYAKDLILQKYSDRIKIPDIREGFEKKVKVSP